MNEYHWGPIDAPIAFIAEAPSDNELTKHEPLVGPSGSIFDVCLESAQLWRRKVYIGNVCRTKISSGATLVRRKKVKGVDTIIGWTEKGEEECQKFQERIRSSTIPSVCTDGEHCVVRVDGAVFHIQVPGECIAVHYSRSGRSKSRADVSSGRNPTRKINLEIRYRPRYEQSEEREREGGDANAGGGFTLPSNI